MSKFIIESKPNRVSPNQSSDFAWYSAIETMGAVDGPGIRLVVFLQGCPLNCLFCHNPETISFSNQEKKITIDEIVELYKRNESFYKSGGVTISGGEPMAQINFLISLFKKLKSLNIHTCVDTAATPFGVYDVSKIKELCKVTDLFIIDIKHPNQEKSIALTGHGNEHQRGFIKLCESLGNRYWIRHVYLPGWSDEKEEYMVDLGRMIGNLNYMDKFEFLPYHTMGIVKYKRMGWSYPLGDTQPPTKENLQQAKLRVQKGIDEVRLDPNAGLIIQTPFNP